MISYLKGTIIAKGSDYIISEAGGVGYKIFVGERRIASFIQGQTSELYCYLYLRKDETQGAAGRRQGNDRRVSRPWIPKSAGAPSRLAAFFRRHLSFFGRAREKSPQAHEGLRGENNRSRQGF